MTFGSAEFNICDLSLNTVLQTQQWDYERDLNTAGDVIQAFNYAWQRFTHTQLEKAFCTLQTVFEQAGGNQYKIPHIGKDAIWEREGIVALRARAGEASQESVDIVETVFGPI